MRILPTPRSALKRTFFHPFLYGLIAMDCGGAVLASSTSPKSTPTHPQKPNTTSGEQAAARRIDAIEATRTITELGALVTLLGNYAKELRPVAARPFKYFIKAPSERAVQRKAKKIRKILQKYQQEGTPLPDVPLELLTDAIDVSQHLNITGLVSVLVQQLKVPVAFRKETPPLIRAIQYDNETLVRELAGLGAALDEEYMDYLPLTYAIARGRPYSAKALLEEGADPTQYPANFLGSFDQRKNTALVQAIIAQCPQDELEQDVADTLNAESKADFEDWGAPYLTETRITTAEQEVFLEVIKLILKHQGVAINQAQALHYAVHRKGTPELIQLLLEHGADPNLVDKEGFSPVYFAIKYQLVDVAKLLLAQKSVVIDLTGNKNRDLLHLAVLSKYYNAEVVAGLLACGANFNSQDELGNTPLLDAIVNKNIAACRQLIENAAQYGVDLNLPNQWNASPIHFAIYYKVPSIVAELLAKNVALDRQLFETGETPLHLAAKKADKVLVQQLLAAKADPTRKDHKGRPPWQRVPLYRLALRRHLKEAAKQYTSARPAAGRSLPK